MATPDWVTVTRPVPLHTPHCLRLLDDEEDELDEEYEEDEEEEYEEEVSAT